MAKYVKIGDLKNHLSGYLRKVRAGAEIVIADRDTPIGRIIPFKSGKKNAEWKMIEPRNGYEGFKNLTFKPFDPPVHVVDLLLEERRRR